MSHLKSPDWTTVPSSVVIAKPQASGIECETRMNSTLNGPICTMSPGKTCWVFTSSGETGASRSLPIMIPSVSGDE